MRLVCMQQAAGRMRFSAAQRGSSALFNSVSYALTRMGCSHISLPKREREQGKGEPLSVSARAPPGQRMHVAALSAVSQKNRSTPRHRQA